MIVGNLKNDGIQILNQKNRYFKTVLETIRATNFSMVEDGKYFLENESLFYILSTYKTKKPEENYISESHREYIDFQYLIYGEELIGYANYDCLKRYQADYDGKKDIELYNKVTDESFLFLKKDMFAVFFPYEIHRPGISYFEERSVRKAIFKILAKDFI